jgi:phosphoglycerol transferase MdoB-like AlkP superfamily enzyme
MTDNPTPVTKLLEHAEEYGKTSLKLIRLTAIDKSADVASSLVSRLAVLFTVVLSVLIVSIGAALWLGKLLSDTYYGFFIVGGCYALLALLLQVFRHEWLKHPVSNSIIKQLMKQKKHEKT